MPGYVPYMYKYAVVDIKPTYNHYIFIPDAKLHSPKVSFKGPVWARPLTCPSFPLEPPLLKSGGS